MSPTITLTMDLFEFLNAAHSVRPSDEISGAAIIDFLMAGEESTQVTVYPPSSTLLLEKWQELLAREAEQERQRVEKEIAKIKAGIEAAQNGLYVTYSGEGPAIAFEEMVGQVMEWFQPRATAGDRPNEQYNKLAFRAYRRNHPYPYNVEIPSNLRYVSMQVWSNIRDSRYQGPTYLMSIESARALYAKVKEWAAERNFTLKIGDPNNDRHDDLPLED